jgi:hypothetical protein
MAPLHLLPLLLQADGIYGKQGEASFGLRLTLKQYQHMS